LCSFLADPGRWPRQAANDIIIDTNISELKLLYMVFLSPFQQLGFESHP
jgi:hypothetical protein